MNNTDENKNRAAEELESDAEGQQDLDQGMQTGTQDATYTGINWGSSYKTKPKSGKKQ